MKPKNKFLIEILTFLLLLAFMVTPIYAADTTALTPEQLTTILQGTLHSGTNDQLTYSWAVDSFTYSDVTYYAYGTPTTDLTVFTTSTPTVSFPVYLSGYESITFDVFYAVNQFPAPDLSAALAIVDSVGTDVTADLVTSVTLSPTTSEFSGVTYRGKVYRITVTGDIDILKLNLSSVSTSAKAAIFGFTGISITGAGSSNDIQTQITNISIQLDGLLEAINEAISELSGIAIQNGEVIDSVKELEQLAQNIEANQQIIMYSTDDDKLVIQELDSRFEDVKDALQEYKDILEQYHNPPDVSNVTNIINQGIPQEYNPQVMAPVLGVIFDNSIVTTILIAVIALMIMSYILFGKKG